MALWVGSGVGAGVKLVKVPGSRQYRAAPDGLRAVGQSDGMGRAALEVAQRMAGNANAVGDATYEADTTTVRGGWANEARAGATVRVTEPHWRDSRDAVLVRVAEAMRVRNP